LDWRTTRWLADAGGSGLGLAIAAELVAARGGALRIADSPLGGTRTQVTLPGSDSHQLR
jgi:signal transduction histidine kinase